MKAWLERAGGPAAIIGSVLFMSLQDALVKLISDGLPLWQLYFLRACMLLPVMAFLASRRGSGWLRLAFSKWVTVRSTLIVTAISFFYAPLPLLDLPTISAVYYMGPIFIVLLSPLLLRERVTPLQYLAVLVAFAGVLMVLRPGSDAFSLAALLPLASATAYAFAALTARKHARNVHPVLQGLSLNVVFATVGLAGMAVTAFLDQPDIYPFMLQAWSPLTAQHVAALVALAVLFFATQFLLVKAYQLGPMATVAGLDFAYLGFAALWAFLFFQTIPQWSTIAGTALIGGAGIWGMLLRRRG